MDQSEFTVAGLHGGLGSMSDRRARGIGIDTQSATNLLFAFDSRSAVIVSY